MGMNPRAILAYGWNLGSEQDGTLDTEKLPWFDPEEHDDFSSAVEEVLLKAIGYTEVWSADADPGFWDRRRAAQRDIGVKIISTGTWDYCGYLMVVTDQRVEWTEVKIIDTTLPEDADDKLHRALAALPGLVPLNPLGPDWILASFYG